MAPHVIVLPFPTQGHLNPMLQFAKDLTSKGLRVTLVTTSYITSSIKAQAGKVSIASISDGYDEGGPNSAPDIQAYHCSFEVVGARTLAELMEEQNRSVEPFTCMVFDTLMAWGNKVAQSVPGLPSIAFSTQSCAVTAIYYHFNNGSLDPPMSGAVNIFGLPSMERSDFPSLALKSWSYPPVIEFALNQLNSDNIGCVLLNSFDELEFEQAIASFKNYFNIRAIGPSVPFQPKNDGSNAYGISLLEAEDDTCIKWLNLKPTASVIYISFGCIASLQKNQMEELYEGLKSSGMHFLWVIRADKQKTLPNDFVKDLSDNGLIVTWSPQLTVLAHEAVGCFITHSGWNSTLEAICFGVPIVAKPLWFDQLTNAKFIADVWGVDVRARKGEEGLVRRDEIMRCVKEIMHGEKGGEIKKNVKKRKELAKEAVSNGGSSNQNRNEFVAYVNEIAEESHNFDFGKGS